MFHFEKIIPKNPKTSLGLSREFGRMWRIKGWVIPIPLFPNPLFPFQWLKWVGFYFWKRTFPSIKIFCLILKLQFLHFCAILMNLWIFLHCQQIFVYNQLFVYIFISKEIIMQIIINLEEFWRIIVIIVVMFPIIFGNKFPCKLG